MIHASLQVRRIDVHDEAGAFVEGNGERLRTTHTTAARREREGAGQCSVKVLGGHRTEGLVGALHDALGADVDPRTGRHLAIHRQTEGLQTAKLRPCGPVAHEIRVGDQHSRCPLVRAHHAHWPAGLHQHRLVVTQCLQRAHQSVKTGPVARRPSSAAVDHEGVGVFGHLRIEVVSEHPHRGFLRPAHRGAGGATRCSYWHWGSEGVSHW